MLAQGASPGFIDLINVHLGEPISEGDILSGGPNFAYFFNDKGFFRLTGGNERLAAKMADDFGRDSIVLNAQVISIDQTGRRVSATTKDGRTFHADKAICTIPPKVLNEIAVKPGWSAGKSQMFTGSDGLQWIDCFKGFIQTQTPSWLKKGSYGWPMAATDQPWTRVMDITGNEGGGYGNAFFYIFAERTLAGLKAITRQNNPDPMTARTQLMIDHLHTSPGFKNLFYSDPVPTTPPTPDPNFVTIDSIMWADGEEVPWIKAALATGVKPWMRDQWTKPDDKIHFAGDFASYKSGWVEGALESGLRAATEINPQATSG